MALGIAKSVYWSVGLVQTQNKYWTDNYWILFFYRYYEVHQASIAVWYGRAVGPEE